MMMPDIDGMESESLDLVSDNESIGHNEPMVYEIDEEVNGELVPWTIYRISSTGRCLLELVAAKTGWPAAPPPEVIQKAFDRGHQFEKAILDQYQHDTGVGLTDFQKRVEFVIMPGIKLVGHIDARAMGTGNVVDAKFYSEEVADRIVRDPEKYMPVDYLYQAAGYGAACGNVGVDFVFGRRVVTHGQVSELDGIHVVSYDWDELKGYLGKIRVKVLKAEKIAREDLEWPLCENAKKYPCPYHELRLGKGGRIEAVKGGKDPSKVLVFDSSDTAGLAKTLWEEREVQSQAEANAKKGKDELNKRIRVLMEQQEGEAEVTETWDLDGVKVLRVVKQSELYNWAQIRKDIPDFDKKYKMAGEKIVYLQRGRGK